jgi:hypothetical protein
VESLLQASRVGLAIGRKGPSRVIIDEGGLITCNVPSGETLVPHNSLSVSVALGGAVRQQEALADLPGTSLVRCLTSVPAALANVFEECSFSTGGERFEVWRDAEGVARARSYPIEGPDEDGSLRYKDLEVPIAFATAFAAAMCDPDRVPNHAHLLPGTTKARWTRLREPILNLATAAALLLAGLGIWFHREKAREEAYLEDSRQATVELWTRVLPADVPKESGLPGAMLRRLRDAGEGDAGGPSALAFWAAIGQQFPDPEPLGLCVESLDLSPEGGRLSARLPAAKENPLKNATALEGHLNQSERVRARGDYEVLDGQVHVRLRMEFKP